MATPWSFSATASRRRGRTARLSKTIHCSVFPTVKFASSTPVGAATRRPADSRIERDVFERGATVLIVAYGVNDIGWGLKADAEHKRVYLDAIRGIVEQCRRAGHPGFYRLGSRHCRGSRYRRTRIPPGHVRRGHGTGAVTGRAFDRHRAHHAHDSAQGSGGQRDVRAARQVDAPCRRRHSSERPGTACNGIRDHQGAGAPAEVSSLTVDADGPKAILAEGCRVTNLSGQGGDLVFDRLDDGLPVNFGLFGALQFRFVPIPDELNRYMLTVARLAPGRYDVLVDGRALGTFSEKQLAAGLNIASATADGWEPGGPWDAAASVLISMTEARDQIANAERFLDHYLPRQPDRTEIHAQSREINERIEALQRLLLKPRRFHFVVRRAPSK